MPSANLLRTFVPENFYHVYNRGVYRQPIFIDEKDYAVFLSLFKKHLSKDAVQDRFRRPVAHLYSSVELLAYCLLPSHFHLLIFNIQEKGLLELMRRTMTAYSMYFNKRYKRRGVLFESSYKAKLIDDDSYLWHISRYIHLNPQDLKMNYSTFPHSSYQYYIGSKKAEWLNTDRILEMHKGELQDYVSFVKDYEAMRRDLQNIKHQLAGH